MKVKRVLKWSASVILLALVVWLFIAYWMSTNDCDRRAAPNSPMKAVTHCEYGGPEVLKVEDMEKPVPNDDQLLVRVPDTWKQDMLAEKLSSIWNKP